MAGSGAAAVKHRSHKNQRSDIKQEQSHWPLSVMGGIVSVLNLALPLVLVRILPQEQMGQYKIYFLYLVMVPWLFLTAGINNGLPHWAGKGLETMRRAFRQSWTYLVSAALVIWFVGFAGLGLAMLWPHPKLAGLVALTQYLGGGASVGAWWTSVAFILAAGFSVLAQFHEEALIAQGQVWRGAVFSSGFDLLRNLGILGAALWTRQISAVFWAHTFFVGAKVIVGSFMGYAIGFQRITNLKGSEAVLRYGIPVSLSALGALVSNFADQIILSSKLGAKDFAIYSLGCLAIPPLMIFEQSVNRVLITRLASGFSRGDDHKKLMGLFNDALSELAWVLVPAALSLAVFADPIVSLFFTDKYAASAKVLRFYGLFYLMFSLPYDALARSQGWGTWILRQSLIFSALSLLLISVAASKWGIAGALTGFFISQYLMRLTGLWSSARKVGWPMGEMFPVAHYARYWLASLICCGFSLALRPLFQNQLMWMFVAGPLALVLYVLQTAPLAMKRRAQSVCRNEGQARALLLTQYLGLGGLERVVLNLALGLKNTKSYEPIVFVYDEMPGSPTLHDDFSREGIPVVTVIKDSGLSWRVIRALVKEVWQRRIAVIHSHDLGALIYGVLAKLILLGGVRLVHTQHSFVHLGKSSIYQWYERFFSFFADELCCVSESIQEQYKEVGIPPANVAVVHNGVAFAQNLFHSRQEQLDLRRRLIATRSDESVRKFLLSHLDKTWVLCLARVHPKKGQDHVAKLWQHADVVTKENAILIYMGAETAVGALDQLKSLISKLGLETAVYAGYTLAPVDWLMAADIFVSASEFEGMPLGPIEAAGAGLECLISDIPGHAMLPEWVVRFDLNQSLIGAHQMDHLVARMHVKPYVARSQAWQQAVELRQQWGIDAMANQYAKHYQE